MKGTLNVVHSENNILFYISYLTYLSKDHFRVRLWLTHGRSQFYLICVLVALIEFVRMRLYQIDFSMNSYAFEILNILGATFKFGPNL